MTLDAIRSRIKRMDAHPNPDMHIVLSYGVEQVRHDLHDLLAEVDRLKALVDDDRHIVEIREHDFSLQHPVDCRPDLIGCAVNQALNNTDWWDDQPTIEYGRHVVELTGGVLVFGEKLP